ncbi:MAG TPA: hypothetical protein VEA79_11550 [Phenylobacterium sp.]|nr:hypothetical protein [Phenylobacterium sp.]
MLRLVEKLEAEVARFEAEPPPEPAARIKFITDAARAGRAIVLAEAAAVRAEHLVEGVGQRNPGTGAEDKDGDGMRDDDFSPEQLAQLRDELEQAIIADGGALETKSAVRGRRGRQAVAPEDPRLVGRTPARPAG